MSNLDPAYDDELEPDDAGLERTLGHGPDEGEEEADWEAQARAMGWHPLPADPQNPTRDEYRGDPRRWVPAREFVETAQRELPVLRQNLKRLTDRVTDITADRDRLRTEVAEQTNATREALELAKRADQRGYERARAELLEERREAVEAGDTAAFDSVQEKLDELERQQRTAAPAPAPAAPREEPPAEPAPRDPPGQIQPEIKAFVEAHPWFNDKNRPYLQGAMIAFHAKVCRERTDLSVAAQLDEALAEMERAFPEILEDGAPPPPPRQEPPVRQPQPRPRRPALNTQPPGAPRRAGGSPFDRITDPDEKAQARKAFEVMKRADPGFTEDEYMALYDDPHLDVLTLRAQRK